MRECNASFLQACLLLLIRERPGHGYDLAERLEPFGLAGSDAASTYRALRALEREGSVESHWTPSACGPERRVYRLTEAGAAALTRSAQALSRNRAQLDEYLRRHEGVQRRDYWQDSRAVGDRACGDRAFGDGVTRAASSNGTAR
jgi:DNA-binding PadR family transcriptional regulator